MNSLFTTFLFSYIKQETLLHTLVELQEMPHVVSKHVLVRSILHECSPVDGVLGVACTIRIKSTPCTRKDTSTVPALCTASGIKSQVLGPSSGAGQLDPVLAGVRWLFPPAVAALSLSDLPAPAPARSRPLPLRTTELDGALPSTDFRGH